MRIALLVVLAALAALAPRAGAARGFFVDVDALASLPVGSLGSGTRESDVLDAGYGVRAEVLYQVRGHFSAGLGVSALSYGMSVRDRFVVADANATVLPVYALARLHTRRAGGFGAYAETGVGLQSWNRNPVGVGTASSTQTAFSYAIGGGASYLLSRRWDVRAGAQWQQAVTGPGEVWARGDDPKFVTFALGLRFQQL